MIHTIARYYSTNERMTALFACITDQMIVNCKASIWGIRPDEVTKTIDPSLHDSLWEKDEQELVRQLESCLKLSEAYQEQRVSGVSFFIGGTSAGRVMPTGQVPPHEEEAAEHAQGQAVRL